MSNTVHTTRSASEYFVKSWKANGWEIAYLSPKKGFLDEMTRVGGLFAAPTVLNYGFTPGDVYQQVFTSFDRNRLPYAMFGSAEQWANIKRILDSWSDKSATHAQILQRVGDNTVHVQPDGAEYLAAGWSKAKLVWYSEDSIAVNGFRDLKQCVDFVRPIAP